MTKRSHHQGSVFSVQDAQGTAAMIQQELLDLLQCPKTKSPLRVADESLIAKINEAIAAGTIKNRVAEAVEAPLSGGLLPEGENVLYPIVDDLPIMLVDEAIPLEQLESGKSTNH